MSLLVSAPFLIRLSPLNQLNGSRCCHASVSHRHNRLPCLQLRLLLLPHASSERPNSDTPYWRVEEPKEPRGSRGRGLRYSLPVLHWGGKCLRTVIYEPHLILLSPLTCPYTPLNLPAPV